MSDALPVIEPQTPISCDFICRSMSTIWPRACSSSNCCSIAPPAKQEHDYAKFEVDEPPLVLSLEPNRTSGGGKLNHLGFRLASREALVALQRRLEMAGVRTTREEGVECCYSRQTKFWLSDPDGNLWELYTLEGRSRSSRCRSAAGAAGRRRDVAHIRPRDLGTSPGRAISRAAVCRVGNVDEVFLQGTFNARLSESRSPLGFLLT